MTQDSSITKLSQGFNHHNEIKIKSELQAPEDTEEKQTKTMWINKSMSRLLNKTQFTSHKNRMMANYIRNETACS